MNEVRSETTATVAAVDLGSNSFHMVVARRHHGDLQVLDRLKLMVRLGEGLDDTGALSDTVRRRALEALERFGQRLQGLSSSHVRVVGTNTLREMRDADAFMAASEAALGHPVEVVSGVEEARLIYLGVARSLGDEGGRRLVVDIGGGSTEVVIGEGAQPLRMESLEVGCVNLSRRCFADGRLSESAVEHAALEAERVLEPVVARFRAPAFAHAVGASGTVKAVHRVLAGAGQAEESITRDALMDLGQRIAAARSVDALDLPGLDDDRRPVFPAGVAILTGLFRALDITAMQVSDGALREGVLHDLVGRMDYHDVRDQTVAALASRYHVDTEHAARVERTALSLQGQVEEAWGFDREARNWLAWAARLHEIGLDVAHSGYHRHGEYIARHGDLGGFSAQDQAVLAALIRCHRRKIARSALSAVPQGRQQRTWRLVPLLRLAVVLHRSRLDEEAPPVRLRAKADTLTLTFPTDWLYRHPLTAVDLKLEQQALTRAGYTLTINEADTPNR